MMRSDYDVDEASEETREAMRDRCEEEKHSPVNCCSVTFRIYQRCKWCGAEITRAGSMIFKGNSDRGESAMTRAEYLELTFIMRFGNTEKANAARQELWERLTGQKLGKDQDEVAGYAFPPSRR